MTSREEFQHVFHRQRGIIDQSSLSSLQPLVGGDDEGILSALLQLKLLGSSAIIHRNPGEDVDAERLKALLPRHSGTWSEVVQELYNDSDKSPSFDNSRGTIKTDIWAGRINSARPDGEPGLWLLYGNGRALVGSGGICEIANTESRHTFLDLPTLICGSSALVHRYAMDQGVFLSQRISDCWVSMTARIDDIGPEEAVRNVRSRFGNGTATHTSDGNGSLIRFRIPITETPESLIWQIESEKAPPPPPLEEPLDVGPLSAKSNDGTYSFSESELPLRLSNVDALVLGAGGLGSWAIPLLISGCDTADSRITIVDGDQRVEAHNLNRQVLYTTEDIGKPKAHSARRRVLRSLGLREESVRSFASELHPRHAYDKEDHEGDDMVTLEEIAGEYFEDMAQEDDGIIGALDSMQVALSCLDNQYARTTLNRACNDRGVTMVNGGCEGTVGLVEIFSGDRCMVCSYGPEEALSLEKISCQEEGSRPVNSIVTTSSYVGSMMACIALCELARQRGYDVRIPEPRDIVDGMVSKRCSGSLPWIKGVCDDHL